MNTQTHNKIYNKTSKPRISLKELHTIKQILRQHHLHTVCEEAKCPNITTCFAKKTATFLIMGQICTRHCKFCNIGSTLAKPQPLDPREPQNIKETILKLGLKYVVITSVTRDDLPDGGANHFAQTIHKIHEIPNTKVEVLTPDFNGDPQSLQVVLNAAPDVFNHNIETVERLTPYIRDRATYKRSLEVLKFAALNYPKIIIKSGLMVGLGETKQDLEQAFHDLASIGVKVLTIGQYYAPSKQHYPVKKYYTKEEFDELKKLATKSGIPFVFSDTNVRSSFMAEEVFHELFTI